MWLLYACSEMVSFLDRLKKKGKSTLRMSVQDNVVVNVDVDLEYYS